MKNLRDLSKSWVAILGLAMVCAAVSAQTAGRFVGTLTAVSGNNLTVKTDAGEERQVQVSEGAVLKRLAPGEKDLAAAPAIAVTDLAVGDRVLVKLDPGSTSGVQQAVQIVAMKQSDVALKQQGDQQDWQRRGIGGLVKTVDSGSGTLVVSTGAGPTAKSVTVDTTASTKLLRYASGSFRFDEAKPAPITEIKAGDQLRAKGDKNSEGTELKAEQVISGTFRHVSGMILDLDTKNGTITLKDLATKKPMTVHVAAESQILRIPERAAQFLAARLNGQAMGAGGFQRPAGAGQGQGQGQNQGSNSPGSGRPAGSGGQMPAGGGMAGGPAGGPGGSAGGFATGGGDPQQMLSRLPPIKISDLQKGEAVMVVATDGTTDVNAVTVLAGVEPLLQAPAASNLLSNWSMGGGGAEGAGAQ